MCQPGINDGTIVAMLGVDAWRVHKPVKHGDTLEVAMTVTDKRRTSKSDKGIVSFKREIHNQRGEVVHSMNASSMYLCRQVVT
jgi:acyl dehydratase